MNRELLLKYFERISEAPNAVPRLRRFVLDLAVRGKLVGQDPDDEPASFALDRIQAAKVARNRVERAKKETVASNEDRNFLLPAGWVWASLTDLVAVINGRAYSQNELLDKGTPVLRVGNLFTSQHWYYSNLKLDEDKYCDEGDLIFAWSASFGPFIWPGPKVIYHYHIWKLALHSERDLDKLYLYRVLLQKTQEIKNSGHGISMLHMTKEKMERVQVPLPPLNEQRRIVAKVDELMMLCDRLDAAQKERESQRDRLAAASLHRLNDGASAEAFRDCARFYFNQLHRLTIRHEHVERLRQTILSLAVRGRLSLQDTSDQPVQTQLGLGDQTRRSIAKEDRRADAEPQTLLAAEDRWEVPRSWEWRPLADLVLFIDYRGKTPNKIERGVRLVTAKNVKKGFINASPEEFLSESNYHTWMTRGIPKRGDILFTTEAPMGNAAVVRLTERFALAQRVICFRSYGAVDSDFLVLQLLAEPFQVILEKTATGLTAKGIKAAKLKRLPIAVPPLGEQRRIVAKVDELMKICDNLETQLAASETESRRLLETVLYNALAPAGAEAA